MSVQRRIYERKPSVPKVRNVLRCIKKSSEAIDKLLTARLGSDDRCYIQRIQREIECAGDGLKRNLIIRYQRNASKIGKS